MLILGRRCIRWVFHLLHVRRYPIELCEVQLLFIFFFETPTSSGVCFVSWYEVPSVSNPVTEVMASLKYTKESADLYAKGVSLIRLSTGAVLALLGASIQAVEDDSDSDDGGEEADENEILSAGAPKFDSIDTFPNTTCGDSAIGAHGDGKAAVEVGRFLFVLDAFGIGLKTNVSTVTCFYAC